MAQENFNQQNKKVPAAPAKPVNGQTDQSQGFNKNMNTKRPKSADELSSEKSGEDLDRA